MARVRSQEDVTAADVIRRRKRSKKRSSERKRMGRRWRQTRQQKPENVSSSSVFSSLCTCVFSVIPANVSNVSHTEGVNPFAKEAGSPVKPSLTPSE